MTVLVILLKITVVTVFGLVASRLARRRPASIRHLLLTATVVLALLVPFITVFGPALCVIVPLAPTEPASGHSPPAVITPPTRLADRAAYRGPDTPSSPALPWRQSLAVVWVIGSAISCWPVLAGSRRIRSLRRSSLPWRAQSTFEDARESAGRHRPRRDVAVGLHECVHGPVTWGLLRPIVLFPADARTWPAADIERALIHEFEHIRRHDWLTQRAARLVCAIYWFHPLMWVVWHQITLEAERACDDAVISRGESVAYADQLLRLAERQARGGKQAALLAMAGRHELATRIRAVLDSRQPRGRVSVLAAAVIVLGTTTLAAATTPVQFVPLTLAPVIGAPSPRSSNDPQSSTRVHGVRMPKRSLPAALTAALTLGVVAPSEPPRAQEPVFTVKDMYYAPANGLTAETDEDFIKHAHRLCAIEIQTAKLALTKTSNPDVKAFAERLVADHSAITRALAQWAAKKQVVLKDDDPSVKMKLDKHKSLEPMNGADFDRAFLAAIMDHQTDGIHLVSNEKRNTKDAGLTAFAEETRLALIAQNNAARALRAKLK